MVAGAGVGEWRKRHRFKQPGSSWNETSENQLHKTQYELRREDDLGFCFWKFSFHTQHCRSRCRENGDSVSCKEGWRWRKAFFTNTIAAALMVNFLSSHSPQDCSINQNAATRHMHSHLVIIYCLLPFYINGNYTYKYSNAAALPHVENLR